MCPVIDEYIKNEYADSNSTPVRVEGTFEKQLIQMGRKALALERQGRGFIFPKVLQIEKVLLEKIKAQEDAALVEKSTEEATTTNEFSNPITESTNT